MGYRIALWQDPGAQHYGVDLEMRGEYPGVWVSINALAKALYAIGAEVFVYAGDDMDPDPTVRGEDIARQYLDRFPGGLGVMQPCGDPQGTEGFDKPAAARIAGSAWFGREWVRRSYRGNGPTDARYVAFYADESMARVAEHLGVMWWRPELCQKHFHWSWGHLPKQDYHERNNKSWRIDSFRFATDTRENFTAGELIP